MRIMEVIKYIKWGKLKMKVWDKDLEQTCGKIILNYPQEEYVFSPDSIAFDNKQLIKISKLLDKLNSKNKPKTK